MLCYRFSAPRHRTTISTIPWAERVPEIEGLNAEIVCAPPPPNPSHERHLEALELGYPAEPALE